MVGNGSHEEQVVSNLAHVPAYGILALLWLKSFFPSHQKTPAIAKTSLVLAGLLLFALLDEVHQFFVPGRSADFMDIGLDILGITLGFLLFKRLQQPSVLRQEP